MNVRAGETLKPCCARLNADHEREMDALRRRIAVLETKLERKTEALKRLLAIHERLDQS